MRTLLPVRCAMRTLHISVSLTVRCYSQIEDTAMPFPY